jgi:GDP-4-dehydro-6-deoxy-D-mannose reductase
MNGGGDILTVDPTVWQIPFSRILVTGADGFVGSRLVTTMGDILTSDARLVLTTRIPRSEWPADHNYVTFDLEDPESVASAIAEVRPDLIIHLAAQSSVGQSAVAAAATWSLNLCGSLALARAVATTVPDCTLLFASSVEVYGLTFNHEIAKETSALRPQSPYARSKAAAESMFADVLPPTVRLIVARASNHSGAGQAETFVIPAFADQIVRVEQGASSMIRVGNLDAERDFLDVQDVIGAYLGLLMKAKSLPLRSTFNIASGKSVRIGEILDRLRALSSTETTVQQDPKRMRPSEVSRAAVDISAIKMAIEWAPAHSLDEMLAAVLKDRRR